jgi:hypothetical protein
MLEKEITITLRVKADSPFSLKSKVELFEKISRLDREDQERILEICNSQKALKSLKDKWAMLKMMFT